MFCGLFCGFVGRLASKSCSTERRRTEAGTVVVSPFLIFGTLGIASNFNPRVKQDARSLYFENERASEKARLLITRGHRTFRCYLTKRNMSITLPTKVVSECASAEVVFSFESRLRSLDTNSSSSLAITLSPLCSRREEKNSNISFR